MSGTELATFISQQLVQHLWQGLLLAGALALALRFSRRSTSATRHAFCSLVLVALIALPFAGSLPRPAMQRSRIT